MKRAAKLVPMLFSTDMAKANMAGHKTQTRRTRGLKEINLFPDEYVNGVEYEKDGSLIFPMFKKHSRDNGIGVKCPYGMPGDVMWMRERFAEENCLTNGGNEFSHYVYKADNDPLHNHFKWKPSLHMPLEACRFFAKIVAIRLERLNDITEADAVLEGIRPLPGETEAWPDHYQELGSYASARGSYMSLYIKLNGLDNYKINPWVWVVVYERIEKSKAMEMVADKTKTKTKKQI